MRNLNNELRNKIIDFDKLLLYGFIKEKDQYVFKNKICNEQFDSKEDILTNLFNRAAETIVNALSTELVMQNMVNSYRVLFEKVLEIKELFEIIQMAGMVAQFEMAINEKYLHAIDTNSPEAYYRVLSWIGSIFNIIFGWIRHGYQETPEQMAHICSRFLSEKEWQIVSGIKWSTNAGQ